MRSHKHRTYSRWARIRRRLLALRLAPTVSEGLTDVEIRRDLRPSGHTLVMAANDAPAPLRTAGRPTRTDRRP